MMSSVPSYYPDISRRLSHVMDEIGVNERSVRLRRHTGLLRENMLTLTLKSLGNINNYLFGSQTEGTTTLGINSDTDLLICLNNVHVIHNWSEWQQNKMNLFMIDDDESPPGYCRLQTLRSDIPVAWKDLPGQHFEYDIRGRVIMMNTFIHQFQLGGGERRGPAGCYHLANVDIVHAFSCETWPHAADVWKDRYYAKQPHDINLIKKSVQSGCLLVATGHHLSPNERLEWRISTSMAERIFMFKMNITQIRCYVLLKMTIKTFIEPDFPNSISSYYCKTILMYLVENSQNDFWQEDNLLLCVDVCLRLLQICIYTNYCPHYFIPGNNLMAGRLKIRTRQKLLAVIKHIICSYGRAILSINIDNIGELLGAKCSCLQARCDYEVPVQSQYQICKKLFFQLMVDTHVNIYQIQSTNAFEVRNAILEQKSTIGVTLAAYRTGKSIVRDAIFLMMPSLCARMGCLLAAQCIIQGQRISNEAMNYFSSGICSDVASGRLKLASALYCAGYLERTMLILCGVEERFNKHDVLSVCGCTSTVFQNDDWNLPLDIINIEIIFCLRAYFAFGVSFTRGEIQCVPRALRYEMFRCTEEERALRNETFDYWMDYAVVDSLPFLYYLQYMTCRGLGRQRDQQRALDKLIETVMYEKILNHKETVLNLLGQCLEQERRFEEAFVCYKNSLNIRPTHNVAKWHIAMLLSKMANS